ncbi:hypothetical protein [Burkholderia latens]|uniref:Uncharacterized protein n=1 Tax=Burkholderia latens TaxID=488446 RepID=A0A6H9STZ9_9BURK|nr:hypothetical protein [Burkholderia latens]KAB0632774.1 hypothetical protein F7R21_28895 [Burkholderia latens]
MSLDSAVRAGISEINHDKVDGFRPDRSRLLLDLNRRSSNTGATIVAPSENSVGYEVLSFSRSSDLLEPEDSIVVDLWECAKEHYGLTGAAGMPITKGFLVTWCIRRQASTRTSSVA